MDNENKSFSSVVQIASLSSGAALFTVSNYHVIWDMKKHKVHSFFFIGFTVWLNSEWHTEGCLHGQSMPAQPAQTNRNKLYAVTVLINSSYRAGEVNNPTKMLSYILALIEMPESTQIYKTQKICNI